MSDVPRRKPKTPQWLLDQCYRVFPRECLLTGEADEDIQVAHIENWENTRDRLRNVPSLEDIQSNSILRVRTYARIEAVFHRISNVIPLCVGAHKGYDELGTVSRAEILAARRSALLNPLVARNIAVELELLALGRRTRYRDENNDVIGNSLTFDIPAMKTLSRWLSDSYQAGLLMVEPEIRVGDFAFDLRTRRLSDTSASPSFRWWSSRNWSPAFHAWKVGLNSAKCEPLNTGARHGRSPP